jgi:hypothetical protein
MEGGTGGPIEAAIEGAIDARAETLPLANLLGYTAGAVALLQAFVVASSALAHQADIVALQRGLLAYRDNSGGPWLDPQLGRVLPLLVATYLTAAISLAVTVALAWRAGRLAASLGGDLRVAATAGRRVAGISWLFWAIATVFAVVALHADGTFSWAVATAVKLGATPGAQPVTGLFASSPDVAFVAAQFVALSLQLGLGLAAGLYAGALAGERGGERGPTSAPPALVA